MDLNPEAQGAWLKVSSYRTSGCALCIPSIMKQPQLQPLLVCSNESIFRSLTRETSHLMYVLHANFDRKPSVVAGR